MASQDSSQDSIPSVRFRFNCPHCKRDVEDTLLAVGDIYAEMYPYTQGCIPEEVGVEVICKACRKGVYIGLVAHGFIEVRKRRR